MGELLELVKAQANSLLTECKVFRIPLAAEVQDEWVTKMLPIVSPISTTLEHYGKQHAEELVRRIKNEIGKADYIGPRTTELWMICSEEPSSCNDDSKESV